MLRAPTTIQGSLLPWGEGQDEGDALVIMRCAAHDSPKTQAQNRTWIAKLTLTDFRNYRAATLNPGPAPAVLFGANGAGKTNCLEAISLLTAGRGLRSLPFSELVRSGGAGGWAVAAKVFAGAAEIEIGTGVQAPPGGVSGHARASHREGRWRAGQRIGSARTDQDGVADARHGQPVHRGRERAPAFHRPFGAKPRPGLRQRGGDVRPRHAPAQQGARRPRARQGCSTVSRCKWPKRRPGLP